MDLFALSSLSDDQKVVLDCIIDRKGKQSAVPVAEIISRTGIPDRRVRALVKELVEEKGQFIASCPSGFFVPETPEEVTEVYRQYMSWGLSLLSRAARIRKNPRLQTLIGQLEFELKAAV